MPLNTRNLTIQFQFNMHCHCPHRIFKLFMSFDQWLIIRKIFFFSVFFVYREAKNSVAQLIKKCDTVAFINNVCVSQFCPWATRISRLDMRNNSSLRTDCPCLPFLMLELTCTDEAEQLHLSLLAVTATRNVSSVSQACAYMISQHPTC